MSPRVIELREYEPQWFANEELPEEILKALHDSFSAQVALEAPSFLNGQRWKLTSQGWVGYIPLSEQFHFSLVPKVPVRNLFGMLEYAYRLKGFRILEGLTDSECIAELYDRLALILARKVLDRVRKGLYRSYVAENESLPYVHGRIDVPAQIRKPERVKLLCDFEEHTADLEENQILLWTLTRILVCGVCTDRSLPSVRQARRVLQGFATSYPFSAEKCVDRLYNRLNDDYAPMHALCRFFLEHTGPTQRIGDRRMLPVLVNMERLFELFVVEWLGVNLPSCFSSIAQEHVTFQMQPQVSIKIDITINDVATGQTCFVLDTKYKAPNEPASADIEQVVAYAEAKNCRQAVLVYPTALPRPIRMLWGKNINVESLAFQLDGDLEQGGREFLRKLLGK